MPDDGHMIPSAFLNKLLSVFTRQHSIPLAKQIGKRFTVGKSMIKCNIHDLLIRISKSFTACSNRIFCR